MTTQNMVNDISSLLKIPNKSMEELVSKLNLCIGSIISDAITAGEKTVVISLGIGSLSVNLADMQCKFVPSKSLKQTIKSVLETGVDPLECTVEKALAEKLITVCSEVAQ